MSKKSIVTLDDGTTRIFYEESFSAFTLDSAGVTVSSKLKSKDLPTKEFIPMHIIRRIEWYDTTD